MNKNKLCAYCNPDFEGYVKPLPQNSLELDLMVNSECKRLEAFNENGELVSTFKVNYCPMCNHKL